MLEEFKNDLIKSKKTPIISRDKLVKLGSICGITEFSQVLACAKYLHEVGSIVYFGQDPVLSNLVILEPKWLTQALATLFTTKHQWSRGGLLKHQSLGQIWKGTFKNNSEFFNEILEYPHSIHGQLLHLMSKFEMLYQVAPEHQDTLCKVLGAMAPIKPNIQPLPYVPKKKKIHEQSIFMNTKKKEKLKINSHWITQGRDERGEKRFGAIRSWPSTVQRPKASPGWLGNLRGTKKEITRREAAKTNHCVCYAVRPFVRLYVIFRIFSS